MSRDLATILTGLSREAADKGVTFRQGVVSAWSAGSNTISAGGAILTDLPYLDGVSATPGDVVALLRCGNTLLVIGVIVKP